jgi:hypothetical protein
MTDPETFDPVDGFLRRKLYAWGCPTHEQLDDYMLNLLTDDVRAVVAQHLNICPRCQSELETMRNLVDSLDDPSAEPALTLLPRPDKVRARIIQLHPTLPLASSDTVRGTLGFFEREVTILQAENTFVHLRPRREDNRIFLDGRVLHSDDVMFWSDALVEIRQKGELRATAVVDANASFVCILPNDQPFNLHITSGKGETLVIENIQ